MPGRGLVWAALCALAVAGCGGDDSGLPTATVMAPVAPPAACGTLRVRVTGRLRTPAATELSGLALSRRQPRLLWTHNDSGSAARILAVTPDGTLLADVSVTGAENEDWEDIAIAGGTLYIADIGDNRARRPSIAVYRVAEPRVPATATAPVTRLSLRYPGEPRDAEALLVDPAGGGLVIVTKSFSGNAGIYLASRGAATLRRAGTIALGTGEAVTAASLSADGRTIALRSYDRAYVWRRALGESIPAALKRRPCSAHANLLREGQGEAIALTHDGRAFYTVPEGRAPVIRRYQSVAQ
ncbi:MAG: hypothetical protein QOK16_4294 [Solirubrobacteraceae bacterium]|nr:hypothetical protein [Solirubrobacteraceae bacterium]